MPISATDIAYSNALSALEKNRNLEWKVNGIIRALMEIAVIRQCEACEGKGSIFPATAVPCKACLGAGFVNAGRGVETP